MYEPLVRKAKTLKLKSRELRDGKILEAKPGAEVARMPPDLDGAEGLLRNAVALLSDPMNKVTSVLPTGVPASEDLRNLAAELADCWGSLGGVLRRQAAALRGRNEDDEALVKFNGAIAAYDAGLVLEKDERFRIRNSYNLLQRATVPIMVTPEVLTQDDFRKKLHEIQVSVDWQTTDSRVDDPWAYSDLGLVWLLVGDEGMANQAWDQMDGRTPVSDVYNSGLPVLRDLMRVLPDQASQFGRAVERFSRGLEAAKQREAALRQGG